MYLSITRTLATAPLTSVSNILDHRYSNLLQSHIAPHPLILCDFGIGDILWLYRERRQFVVLKNSQI